VVGVVVILQILFVGIWFLMFVKFFFFLAYLFTCTFYFFEIKKRFKDDKIG
jgi:hypothetical protein